MREDAVTRPDGAPGTFSVVDMLPGSTVLALTADRQVYLVREFKYAVERETLELISGAIEEGESPLDAARRELREECGIEAERWIELGVVDPFTSAIRSPNYMFLALDLTETERCPDDGELVEPILLPFDEALRMVMASEITHGATCVALLKAEHYLRSGGVVAHQQDAGR